MTTDEVKNNDLWYMYVPDMELHEGLMAILNKLVQLEEKINTLESKVYNLAGPH